MKCDESKPACLKCRSTGRTCDGYVSEDKIKTHNGSASPLGSLISSQDAELALPTFKNLTLSEKSVAGTNQDRQCFQYFCLEIGQEVSKALSMRLSYDFVLQACRFDESIRSIVVAIGSMGQRLRIHNLLTPDNEEANALQNYAQYQYYKAVKALRTSIDKDPRRPIELAIVSCFLFCIFDFLRGEGAGLVHLRGGLSILRREAQMWDSLDSLREEMVRIFSVIDVVSGSRTVPYSYRKLTQTLTQHGTMWAGFKSFQSPAIAPFDELLGPRLSPRSLFNFPSLNDAQDALHYQLMRMYHFRRWIAADDPTLQKIPSGAHLLHDKLLYELEQWPLGMHNLLQKQGEADSRVEAFQRVVILQINYRATLISLSTCFHYNDDPESYDEHDADFRHIFSLAESLIGPMDEAARNSIALRVAASGRNINPSELFSFYAGVIQPLYMLAIYCRDLELCQGAVTLLEEKPWREGAWDSFSMAKMAKVKIEQRRDDGYYDEET